jgi:ribosomal protein S18 acetylase RimI-like enzyme
MIATAQIRNAKTNDLDEIIALYRRIGATPGGLARSEEEISSSYVTDFSSHASKNGIQLIADIDGHLVGEIHTYALGPKVFKHCLGELTIAVDPKYHGQGIGKRLFTEMLDKVQNEFLDILRVELVARESNIKAITFYESLGFVREGRFEQRIFNHHGAFEADIPMAWFNPKFKLD